MEPITLDSCINIVFVYLLSGSVCRRQYCGLTDVSECHATCLKKELESIFNFVYRNYFS
jgi:hypothetical protein